MFTEVAVKSCQHVMHGLPTSTGHHQLLTGLLQELFATRDELLSMVPVERLLRAHCSEHHLRPVSVLAGAVVRVKHGGRSCLLRVVAAKECGSHFELTLEVSESKGSVQQLASKLGRQYVLER